MTRTVLAIDTATPAVIAAVLRRDGAGRTEVLAQRITVDAHAHAEQLTPNIVAAVANAGLTMGDIEVIGRQSLNQTLSPLDDDDGVIEVGVEVEGVQFGEEIGATIAQAVDVDVHHRRLAGTSGAVHPSQHVGG